MAPAAAALLVFFAAAAAVSAQQGPQVSQAQNAQKAAAPKKSLCIPPATAPAKLEAIIEQCQDEIKMAVLDEALQVLGDVGAELELSNNTRSKREVLTGEERRIAGCLLQCVYRKVKAVDDKGFPTAAGLVRLYSDGVEDRNYLTATLQAVHRCLGAAENKRALNIQAVQDGGYTCDLAYDMFNCVSDTIESICGSQP